MVPRMLVTLDLTDRDSGYALNTPLFYGFLDLPPDRVFELGVEVDL